MRRYWIPAFAGMTTNLRQEVLMSKISILPDLLINKIAAGEVIERPASVVRELVDNAIDAGATDIEVEVLHGGKKLIKVSDNGCGMDREDAVMCFERHATSKIKTEEELFDISTLGFRGEALPAIASVSKITLSTSPADADCGTKVEIGAAHKKEISDAPPVRGTMIEVRDIFYNTPARRKFLKTNPTELTHIIDTVVQKAFAYPGIAFRLLHNNSEVLNAASASDIKERFGQLYGDEMAGEFINVKKESKAITVNGFTSSPDFTRAARSHQLIFINRRPVKNTTVNHAVYNAYDNQIPGGRHPAYFLFIDIDPRSVDVNVHPAKREVKFERPDEIHRFVRAAVYEALNPGHVIDVTAPSVFQRSGFQRSTGYQNIQRDYPAVSEPVSGILNSNSQTDIFTSGITPDVPSFFHIGESFIATATNDGLLIIDQHAAHERIMYEKFLKKTAIESEPLFLPLRIELPVKEYSIIIKHRDILRGLGMDVEEFGGNNVIIRSIPRTLNKADARGLLLNVAEGILEEETSGISRDITEESLLKNIAARIACHKSVRGSEQLSNEELSRMMSDLDKADEPDRCPHGRPTRIYLSLDDLKKMFKRK
ncbi:MAG: DNA mismatch repair endonuclease MutL [Nitrospiraceae bacterium]|nr:MAG: DNA mismatch repair endonuclease MutL [Nitrospiraceae bacterium]